MQLDNGDLLAGTAVILHWVADQHPHCEFLPRAGSKERYLALAWLNFIATELHKGVAVMFSPLLDRASKTRFADGNLAPIFAYIDAHLATRPYLMGEKLSIADAYLYDVMCWPIEVKIDVPEYISIQRFMARMEQKSSVRASLAAEGISVVH